uniref:Terpene synthase n=1 Tax=Streptomyces sp. WT6 TaxID=1486372 RepID=A0A023PXX6_9ACTN|nr:hypothetical protein wt6.28c [Streptomyces sp. WT6]
MEISTEQYRGVLIDFLEAVEYEEPDCDTDSVMQQRIGDLAFVYSGTVGHFLEPDSRQLLVAIEEQHLLAVIRTVTRMVALSWQGIPQPVMLTLSIHFTHFVLGDDSREDPSRLMENFVPDLLQGVQQSHPIWKSMFSFFPEVLGHYGSFLQITMLNSILDFVQACWIERWRSGATPGSAEYPMFLRRLSSLGTFCAATLFPSSKIDERENFEDITTALAHFIPIVALINDLFSFYKETKEGEEDESIVGNICTAEGVSVEQALRKVSEDSVRACQTLDQVLRDSGSGTIADTVSSFIQGYIRWHLCEERYRMEDLADAPGENAVKFRLFRNLACKAGGVRLVDFTQLTPATVPQNTLAYLERTPGN